LLRRAVDQGTGRAARLGRATYGKTGTSQDSRDAYFIGFAGGLITGVWIGHDDNRPMPGAQGGHTPAAIFHAFMAQALGAKGKAPAAPPLNPAQPADLQQVPDIERDYDVEEPPVTDDPGLYPQPDVAAPPLDDTGQPFAEPAAPPPDGLAPRVTAPPAQRPPPRVEPPAPEDQPPPDDGAVEQ
jgi:penicillin-binding protein 1A